MSAGAVLTCGAYNLLKMQTDRYHFVKRKLDCDYVASDFVVNMMNLFLCLEVTSSRYGALVAGLPSAPLSSLHGTEEAF